MNPLATCMDTSGDVQLAAAIALVLLVLLVLVFAELYKQYDKTLPTHLNAVDPEDVTWTYLLAY